MGCCRGGSEAENESSLSAEDIYRCVHDEHNCMRVSEWARSASSAYGGARLEITCPYQVVVMEKAFFIPRESSRRLTIGCCSFPMRWANPQFRATHTHAGTGIYVRVYMLVAREKRPSKSLLPLADSIHNLHTDLDDRQVVTFACIAFSPAPSAGVCVCASNYALVCVRGGRECRL